MTQQNRHALVFGASGLAGWAVVDQLLKNYPQEGTFSQVTALVNRPLKFEDSYWPEHSASRPKLRLVSGINLLHGTNDEFAASLKGKVEDIGNVTHIYYFPYKQEDDAALEVKINVSMLQRTLHVIDLLCPLLEFLVFPSGTKGYGIQLPSRPFKAPFVETMRLDASLDSTASWYHQFQSLLDSASASKPWTWAEVRPDAIVGFVPHGSTFNLTAHWAMYLSIYASVEGNGAKVPFPGTIKAWKSWFNDASSEMIARVAIFASLNPKDCGNGQLFNVADQERPTRMQERWPAFCSYFGLVGVAPINEGKGALLPSEYILKHKHILGEKGVQGVDVFKGDFLDSFGFYLDFDRQLSLKRLRDKGFTEERDPDQSWFQAFERFREASMILKD